MVSKVEFRKRAALNTNIIAAGDPLSGAGLPNGMSDAARATFYGALMLGGLIVCTASQRS